MRQAWTLLILCMMTMALLTSSVSHAMEGYSCIDAQTAAADGHADGDGDQVPADSDKGYPHHHNTCHGHQVAQRTATDTLAGRFVAKSVPVPAELSLPMLAAVDPALRPPQA